MKSKLFFIVPLFLLFSFVSCNENDPVQESQAQFKSFNKPGDQTIFEIVEGFVTGTPPQFTQLAAAIGYVDSELGAGLGDVISTNKGQRTVFAPVDAAFVGLVGVLEDNRPDDIAPIAGVDDIPAEIVLTVLQYHLTNGRRGSNSVVPDPDEDPKTIQTLLKGASFEVNSDLMITDVAGQPATIVIPNVSASNGMIHAIDTVLLPLSVADIGDPDGDFWTFWRSFL